MSSFSADWLRLREPADTQARCRRLTQTLADRLPSDRTLSILDLGAGTGSNARYLAPCLRASSRWLLVDRDSSLLAAALEQVADADSHLIDLSRLDDAVPLVAGRDLVTASALLDLVSEAWLTALLTACVEARAHLLFALTYDGRIVCTPAEADDGFVVELVNRHQRTDKGFGQALGPDAASFSAMALTALGYQVERSQSDWILEADHDALQQQLIEGWAAAAAEIDPMHASRIGRWQERRLGHVESRRSTISVGHEDLAAWPSG